MEDGGDGKLMTVDEFNRGVKAWGDAVRQASRGALSMLTKVYSGRLRGSLKSKVNKGNDDGVAKAIAFRFERYGVFVSYGVGRGWVREGGVVVRAQRVKKDTPLYNEYLKRGYRKSDMPKYLDIQRSGKGRQPKDWLDSVIEKHIGGLADLAGEYYGDASMRQVLEEFDRIKINKKKTS